MKYDLRKLKKIVCQNCENKGMCVASIKCNDIVDIEQIFSKSSKPSHNSDFKAHKSSPKDCFSCCPDNYLNRCTNDYKFKNCNRRKSNPS